LIDTKSAGDVATYEDYKLDERMLTYGDVLSREFESWLTSLRSRDLPLDSLGIEGWFLPEVYASKIAKARWKKTLDISEVVMHTRRTKGIDEVANLREAVKLTDLAYKIGREKLRDGLSEIELFRAIESGLADRLPPYGSVIGDYISGERTLNVDGGPTERRVQRGDTFILDLHICQNQYWSDLCRTFVLGRPSTAQRRVLEALVSAKEAGEAVLAAGTRCGDIFEAVSNELARAGYPRLPHHAGHGLGLDAQEPPWFLPGSDDVLEEGMVCVLEPGIYSTTAGGVRIEDCYIIGKRGPEKISQFPIGF
jgi:Xaa-Pro dipeptidase